MRLLFVENDCSFSNNIVDRLPCARADVRIVHGTEKALIRSLMAQVSAVVIGSGPLDPVRADLVSLVLDAASRSLPLLGICLGHQAIGQAFGAPLVHTKPAHGVPAIAHFEPSRLLPGISGPQQVMRYHSLSLGDVSEPLRVVAWTDGIPMAIEHATLPIAGLQFHPDSFGTPQGETMLAAFFAAVGDQRARLSA